MDTGVLFGHRNDERAFFEWLKRIPCIESYKGHARNGLVVQLKRRPGKNDLWQLLALCHRYGVDMRQLAKFETAKNRNWSAIVRSIGIRPFSGRRRVSSEVGWAKALFAPCPPFFT